MSVSLGQVSRVVIVNVCGLIVKHKPYRFAVWQWYLSRRRLIQ